MLTLSNITGIVLGPDGQALAGATLEFQLSGADTESATASVAVPQRKLFVLTAGGAMPAGAQIWRNTRGLRGTSYILTARWTETEVVGGMTVQRERSYRFPNAVQVGEAASYSVRELLDNPVPEAPGFSVNLDPAAFAALQANIALANASAGVAQSAANVAGAQIFATAAEGIAAVAVGGIFYVPLSPSGGLDIRQKTGASTSVSIGQFLPPTQNPLDTTAGRLTRVGDFGLGAYARPANAADANQIPLNFTGFWATNGTPPHPNTPFAFANIIHITRDLNRASELALESLTAALPRAAIRVLRDDGGGVADYGPWSEIIHQRYLVGQVAQVAGVPTGRVIERGSNANGEFLRLADGTQMCWNHAFGSVTPNIADGSLFRSDDAVWTFPAAFISDQVVMSGVARAVNRWATCHPNTATTATFRAYAPTSQATAGALRVFAIGRWF